MIARIASFEGGDAEEMSRINNEVLVERSASLPSGLRRVMVLMRDDTRWSVVSFFEDEQSARAAEARFEEMGDEIPAARSRKARELSKATRLRSTLKWSVAFKGHS